MEDGEKYAEAVAAASGDVFLNPISEEQLLDKYYKNIAFSGGITKEQGDRAREIIADLENVDDLSELFEIFA